MSTVVQNFTSGDLGISLPDSAPSQLTPTTSQQILGDLAPMDFDAVAAGLQTQLDALGNIITDPNQAKPDQAETLYDSASGDEIIAGGGNDTIAATRGGADWIQAGSGRDIVLGGAGNDLVELGTERDIGYGGAGDDRLFAGAFRPMDEVIAQTVAVPDDQADAMDGGDGDDTLVGDAGNDALFGGAGKDLLVGGAGDDAMFGDHVATSIGTNWSTSLQFPSGDRPFGVLFASGNITSELALQENADVMFGGAGNDYLLGDGGDDYLDGGTGNDSLIGGTGADALAGGSGDDWLDGDGYTNNPTALEFAAVTGHGNDSLDGGAGNDLLLGNGGGDTLFGGDGDDKLWGDQAVLSLPGQLHGTDYLDGGAGKDVLVGGGADDVLYGGAGDDLIYSDEGQAIGSLGYLSGQFHGADYADGEAGNDYIEGNGGADTLFGGDDDDTLWGDASTFKLEGQFHGVDYLNGEAGNDHVIGGGANDTLYGGTGNDMLWGDDSGAPEGDTNYIPGSFHGNDYLDGEDGDDQLQGDGGNDTLMGGAGKDSLYGDDIEDRLASQYHGKDYLDGGDGDDYAEGGGNDDIILGGKGDDVLWGDADESKIGSQFHGNDIVDGGEGADKLLGGGGNDTLLGGEGNDRLDGGAGNDRLEGGAGDDILVGGEGDDVLIDAEGNNTFDAGEGNDTIAMGDGDNELQGGGGNDSITVGNGNNVLSGGSGRDAIASGAGNDRLSGDDGDDVLSAGDGDNTVLGGDGNDTLVSGSGIDVLDGGYGEDTLRAGSGNDALDGGGGNDMVYGEDGNDVLHASYGNDTLAGGAGLDTYVLGYGADRNSAIDDSAEGSIIKLGSAGMKFEDLSAVRRNNDLVVEVRGTSASMRIKDYYASTQTAWVFQDAQGNTTTGQALVDASRPDWGALQASLLKDFQSSTFGAISQTYLDSGYTQRADGSWYLPASYRVSLSTTYTERAERSIYTHRSLSDLSNSWVTESFYITHRDWDTSQWGEGAEDTTVTISTQASTVASDVNALQGYSEISNSQAAWGSVQWTPLGPAQHYDSPWVSARTYVSPADNPTEIVDQRSRYELRWDYYQGASTELTFQDPGPASVDGNLPDYLAVEFVHHQQNFNLGASQLADGDQTVSADENSAVIGGVGNNVIYGAGFAYGGTGNARLIGGGTLMAGTGDQYLQGGETMVVGDGHDTVMGRIYGAKRSHILVNPENLGIDLIGQDFDWENDLDQCQSDAIEAIYSAMGYEDWEESYRYGGRLYFNYGDGDFEGYYDSIGEARDAFNAMASSTTFEEAIGNQYAEWRYVEPLTALYKTPYTSLEDPVNGLVASNYYAAHSITATMLLANDFATLQPLYDAALLPKSVISFGPGLSLADLTLYWGDVAAPIGGATHVTLDILWGTDQGIRIMMPHTGDALNSVPQQLGFSDGTVISLLDLIAMAPPAPNFDTGYFQFHSGMGHQTADATNVTAISAMVASIGDLKIESDGVDLVISINGSSDSLRLEGWYADSGKTPSVLLSIPNGALLTAAELTSKGLLKDGSAGNLTLYGVPDFATTFIGGPNTTLIGQSGNDTYVYNAGSGEVHISDPGGGTLRFGAGITQGMVSLGLGSLMLTAGGPGNAIHLDGFNPQDAASFLSVQNFEFADGSALNFEELLQKGFDIRGTTNADTLTGTSVNDRFHGGEGADRMTGGLGDDAYHVDNIGDVVTELANQGTDTIITTVSRTLSANVENLTLSGLDAINATGNSLNNVLTGNAATNTLNGGAGADTMEGRAGDDSYYVDHVGDNVTEAQGEGTDRVISSISYTLGDHLEDLQLSGTAAVNATGNAQANRLTGNSGANILYGMAGDDRLTGGLGADALYGGAGDDLYEVDNAGDTVIELAGEGTDTVEASVTYTLGSEVENLILTGTAAVNANGNGLGNLLQGNVANNTLTGGAGNDTLNGMKGLDTLAGGTGNDTYLFEDDVDTIAEDAGCGRDTLISRLSVTLAANVEDGVVLGSAISLTGNELSNVLTGNNAANTLDGGAGADALIGSKGNDTYTIDNQADTVIEHAAEGSDTVQSSVNYSLADNVEHLLLTGNAEAGMGNELANKLTGNTSSNKLWGLAGNDELDGGLGADILMGGLGNDKYWVDSSDDLVAESAGEGTDTVYASVSYALADNLERLTLIGSANINAIGNAGNNRLEGNAGNNVLFGGLGNDTYVWGRGSGQDIIVNFDAGKPSGDSVQLGAGIAQGDLGLVRQGHDLILSINGTTDRLTVAGYFENAGRGANALEKICFSDGTSWNHAAVLSRTTLAAGASSAQAMPPAVLAGNPTTLFDAPDPARTKASDSSAAPQTVAESIAAARARFERGLQALKYSVDEQGSLSRSEFAERRTLPLLWNLQDALLDMQLAKNPDGRFTADISMDSRGSRDLGLAIGLLGGAGGMSVRLDQVARPSEVQQFNLAQMG